MEESISSLGQRVEENPSSIKQAKGELEEIGQCRDGILISSRSFETVDEEAIQAAEDEIEQDE